MQLANSEVSMNITREDSKRLCWRTQLVTWTQSLLSVEGLHSIPTPPSRHMQAVAGKRLSCCLYVLKQEDESKLSANVKLEKRKQEGKVRESVKPTLHSLTNNVKDK